MNKKEYMTMGKQPNEWQQMMKERSSQYPPTMPENVKRSIEKRKQKLNEYWERLTRKIKSL